MFHEKARNLLSSGTTKLFSRRTDFHVLGGSAQVCAHCLIMCIATVTEYNQSVQRNFGT